MLFVTLADDGRFNVNWDDVVFHLGWSGSVASMVGLILTGVVFLKVRSIRRDFFNRVRLGQVVDKLKACQVNIGEAIRKKRTTQARAEFASCAAHLEHLRGIVDKKIIADLIEPTTLAITKLPMTDPPLDQLERVRVVVVAATARLENISDDRAWSKQA